VWEGWGDKGDKGDKEEIFRFWILDFGFCLFTFYFLLSYLLPSALCLLPSDKPFAFQACLLPFTFLLSFLVPSA